MARTYKVFKCKCGETDARKFYGRKGQVCSKCHNAYTLELGRRKREYAINKLGSTCVCCKYDQFSCSLAIHHLDPSVKDERFRGLRGWSLDRIDREISSCILLCHNCHSAVHAGFISLVSECGPLGAISFGRKLK